MEEKGNAVLSANIRRLLEIKHKSKSALANALGISRQAISKYVDGEAVPNADRLLAIADFFNVSMDYLMGRTAYPKLANPSAQAATDYCGISLAAAERLHEMKSSDPVLKKRAATINALLTHADGETVLDLISVYLEFDYDGFVCDGERFARVTLHPSEPNGIGFTIPPEYVKAALLSDITVNLGALDRTLKKERKAGQDNG